MDKKNKSKSTTLAQTAVELILISLLCGAAAPVLSTATICTEQSKEEMGECCSSWEHCPCTRNSLNCDGNCGAGCGIVGAFNGRAMSCCFGSHGTRTYLDTQLIDKMQDLSEKIIKQQVK